MAQEKRAFGEAVLCNPIADKAQLRQSGEDR